MKNYKHLIILNFIFLIFGCQNANKDENKPEQLPGYNSINIEIDSIKSINKNSADNLFGIHVHGKDLAVNAHQDLSKQRRILKKGAAVITYKKKAYIKEQKRRKKRIKNYKSKQVENENNGKW